MLFVFAQVDGLIFLLMTDIAMLGPRQSKAHAPTRMEGRKEPLAYLVVEDGADDFERLVRVAHAVAVCQKELVTVDLGSLFLFVQNDATLLLQVFVGPDVVVAREIVYLDTHVRQFRQFA